MKCQSSIIPICISYYKLLRMLIAIRLRKPSGDCLSNIIQIEMLEFRASKKSIWRLKGPMRYLLMFLRETHMIFLERLAFKKSRKDLNQREEISGQKCIFLQPCFIQEVKLCTVLEEEKFVNIVKALEIRVGNCIHVKLVMVQEKCLGK